MKNYNKYSDVDNSKGELIILLDEPKKCPFTGKMYDAIIKVRCNCRCHQPNSRIMHFMPCCDNEFVEIFRYFE